MLAALRAMACCALALSAVAAGAAAETMDPVEHLLVQNQWRAAARAIFSDLRRNAPRTGSLTGNQAEAGFIEDALATVEQEFPVSRVGYLFGVLKRAPSLQAARRKALVEKALEYARANTRSDYLKSGDLAQVSLAYLDFGMEHQAQAIYQEALAAADRGLEEKSNGGYRRISERLATTDLELLRPWMVAPLLQRIDRTPEPFDAAFAYLDLARLASRQGRRAQAIDLLDAGMRAVNRMGNAGWQQVPARALTEFAVQIGADDFAERFGDRRQLAPTYAIRAAANGQREAALALLSSLTDTLYVGFRSQTQEKIISETIQRGDLDDAIFYAQRLDRAPTTTHMHAWILIAELQATRGDKVAAWASYSKAREANSLKTEHRFYPLEVLGTLNLGKSMIEHGFVLDGRAVTLSSVGQARLIPATMIDDRIAVPTAIARSLHAVGEDAEAKTQLLQAYRAARAYPKGDHLAAMRQANALSDIALAAAKMADPVRFPVHR